MPRIIIASVLFTLLCYAPLTSADELTFSSGWANFGKNYVTAQSTRQGNVCVVSGLVRSTTKKPPTKSVRIGTLDRVCRPSARLVFIVNNQDTTARVDVYPDGGVVWRSGFKRDWLSLDGISFAVSSGGDVAKLSGGWSNYGGAWRTAAIAREGDLCLVSGLIKAAPKIRLPSTVMVLPKSCRPESRIIFKLHANSHNPTTRVDVLPDGRVSIRRGGLNGWISLSGISFPVEKAGTPTLVNNWIDNGSGYAGASYTTIGRICSLTGLIRGGTWGHVATLPINCRPRQRLIFNTHANTYNNSTRVDLLPDGRVLWIAGGKSTWMSFAGINFAMADTPSSPTIAVGPQFPPLISPAVTRDVQPPIDGYTKRRGAAPGSNIDFRSNSGFDAENLPPIDQLEFYLDNIQLEVTDRQANSVIAKLPYTLSRFTGVRLRLFAKYRGVLNSVRVLDPAYLVDSRQVDEFQARITRIEVPEQDNVSFVTAQSTDPDGVLENLPYSQEVVLLITVQDFPLPTLDIGSMRTNGGSKCFNLDTGHTGTHNRQPDGSMRFRLTVYFIEGCVIRPSITFKDTLHLTRIFTQHMRTDDNIEFRVRRPRRVVLNNTGWLIRNLRLRASSPFIGKCTGTTGESGEFQVGALLIDNDIAVRIRSSSAGSDCAFSTHRLRLSKGIRLEAPHAAWEILTVGDSCGNRGSRSNKFTRIAPDKLPPPPDEYGQIPLFDELPTKSLRLGCRSALEGGIRSNDHFVDAHFDSIAFLIDRWIPGINSGNVTQDFTTYCFNDEPLDDCIALPSRPPE